MLIEVTFLEQLPEPGKKFITLKHIQIIQEIFNSFCLFACFNFFCLVG